MYDQATKAVAGVLGVPFESVGKDLSNDYGGTMEHLWIDFELIQEHAIQRPSVPFRFQKKVGGSIFPLTGLRTETYHNVGHYGISPDFPTLFGTPLDDVPRYALGLIYDSTARLLEKQKKLGGFDALRFRRDFLSVCGKLGYAIDRRDESGNMSPIK